MIFVSFGFRYRWPSHDENEVLGEGKFASSIIERTVIVEGQVIGGPLMPVNLTFDQRVLDGAPVSTFLAELKDRIENPAKEKVPCRESASS